MRDRRVSLWGELLGTCCMACVLTCVPVRGWSDMVTGSAAETLDPATDPKALKPRMDVGAQLGNKRSIFSTELWLPLAQRYDRVLYADARLMGDNRDNQEGNFGIGYRVMNTTTNSVLGVHGWFDRRHTQNNSRFNQFTLGVESLGHDWDMRANTYVPLNDESIIGATGTTNPYLAGTGLFYDVNGFLVETPQYGVDAEIGYRIPILQQEADTIRVFGGGYHFFRDQTKNVTGFRVRTEAQITSAFSIGARYQYDAPRGSQGFLDLKLRFPFDSKKAYQQDHLRARLDESPERDVDIVTASTTQAGTQQVAVKNRSDGTAQRVIHVDNSNADISGGDGSLENPYTTLKAAEAVLQDNDVLYVNRGTGTTLGMDEGINITQDGILLIGSGSDFIWDNGRYTSSFGGALPTTGAIITAATAAPVITNINPRTATGTFDDNLNGNGVLITSNNVSITGISVDGLQQGYGIAFFAVDGKQYDTISITNNDVQANMTTNPWNNGIKIGSDNVNESVVQNILISNNLVNVTGGSARSIQLGAIGLKLQNVSIIDNDIERGNIIIGDGIVIEDLKVHRNTIAQGSLAFYANRATTDITADISENIIENGQFSFSHQDDGKMTANIYNNSFTQTSANGQPFVVGQSATATENAELNLNLHNNIFTKDGTAGGRVINISKNGLGTLNIDFGGGSLGSVGQNSFLRATGTNFVILSGGSYDLFAQNNWWGSAAGLPAGQSLSAGSSVDASNPLVADPN